jgi:anti-sigma factor RsiW
VREHLQECARCAAELESRRSLRRLLDGAPGLQAPPEFAGEVLRQAARRQDAGRERIVPLPWSPAPALVRVAAALAIVFGIGLGGLTGFSAIVQRPQTQGADELMGTLLSAAPPGSVSEAYLEWIGEEE